MTKKQIKQLIIVSAIKNSVREHEDQGDKDLGEYTVWTSWIMWLTGCTYNELSSAMRSYREETGNVLLFSNV